MKETNNRLLKDTLAACRGGFVAVVLFSLCINLLMLAAPLYMLQVFDRVLTSRSTDTLVFLTLIAGFAFLILAALEMVRSQVMVRLSTWLDQRLSGAVFIGGVAAALGHGRDPSVQGLRDFSTFRTFLTGPAIFPFMDAPWTPIFIAVIYMLHPLLGSVALGGAVVLLAIAVTNELTTRKLLQLSSTASIKSLHQAEAAVRNSDVIEAMGMMPNLVQRWDRQNAETVALQARASNRSGAIMAVAKFVRLFLQVGILGAGASLVLVDQITAGAMIATSILMGRALAPVDMALNAWRSAIAARSAYRRFKQQLEETPPRGQSMSLPAPEGEVRVAGVTFIHAGASEPALRGVSFQLEPGESLGIVGPTAAGKTSLARLLVGNLQPQAGHVRLDGAEVGQWDSEDMGRHIGYLPQTVELFSGTVRENIARMGEGDSKAVIEAARLADVHDVILGLPAGYDTEIGEAGATLSGGQRQRIALARAMFGDPRFVVMDEPNANLDQRGEEALLHVFDRLIEQAITLVIIAHRPSILRSVDKILVLRAGTVQLFGPRDQIIPQVTGPQSAQNPPTESDQGHG